jgi:hypothetical protein
MRSRTVVGMATLLTVAFASPVAARPAGPSAVPFVDAHSHVLPGMTPAQEIAMFRDAGLNHVIIMDPQPAKLEAFVAAGAGYVTPFVTVARLNAIAGLRLDAATAGTFAGLADHGAVCGFGELPTRLEQDAGMTDLAALTDPRRQAIYDVADARALPVTVHLSLETPEVIAAVEEIAARHPHMTLVLAHAGVVADAALMERLLDAHPNLMADLSMRLDRVGGWPEPGRTGPVVDGKTSILLADGTLQPDWRALIERHPDRFMFGMDLARTERPTYIRELVATARTALGPLPIAVQHAVAHGNVEALTRTCALGLRPGPDPVAQ